MNKPKYAVGTKVIYDYWDAELKESIGLDAVVLAVNEVGFFVNYSPLGLQRYKLKLEDGSIMFSSETKLHNV